MPEVRPTPIDLTFEWHPVFWEIQLSELVWGDFYSTQWKSQQIPEGNFASQQNPDEKLTDRNKIGTESLPTVSEHDSDGRGRTQRYSQLGRSIAHERSGRHAKRLEEKPTN